MARTSTTLPVIGDRLFVMACKAVAARSGLTMAEWVRKTLDDKHEQALREAAAFLLAESGPLKVHLTHVNHSTPEAEGSETKANNG